ncbi:MAG: flavin reductase family protein [Candidatus Brocadiaceae bacterium]|nr:flavin reductase family protein [Candidatus Brocadiaceae bacterium]
MEWTQVEYTHNLGHTLEILRGKGLLLTTVGETGRPNTMTIGWGSVGVIWSRPVFTVLVRPSRHTFANLRAHGEFVVSVPDQDMGEVCDFCGTESGRDVDKFERCGLTPVDAATVSVPLIAECVRHYECRVVHRNDVLDAEIADDIRAGAYPQGNLHRLYYGQILRTTERA